MQGRRIIIAFAVLLVSVTCLQCVQVQLGTGKSKDNSTNATVASTNSSASSTATFSTETAGSSPTVDQIIERYLQALGGAQALSSVQTIEAKGSFQMPESGVSGTVTGYFKAPNKFALVIKSSDGEGVIRLFDGERGWERTMNPDAGTQTRELRGLELQQLKLSSDMLAVLKFREIYSRLTLKGRQRLEDKEAYVIEAVSVLDKPETLYFDVQTGFLSRKDFTEFSSRGERRAETYLEDYKAIPGANGAKAAFTSTTFYPDDPDSNYVVEFKEFKANAPLNEQIFLPPRR
jgi:photosynthetic reaction center cytochrome c subunit